MRLFEKEHVGCWLDTIGHRVEDDTKMLDLTLRVEPFTSEMASALDHDVRTLLFKMTTGALKSKIKAIEFAIAVPAQLLTVRLVPELEKGEIAFDDCAIAKLKAHRDKGKDEYIFTVRVSVAQPSARQLEYVIAWHTEERFVTFNPTEAELDLAGIDGDSPRPESRAH